MSFLRAYMGALKDLGAGKGIVIKLLRGYPLDKAAHDFVHPAFSGQDNIRKHSAALRLLRRKILKLSSHLEGHAIWYVGL